MVTLCSFCNKNPTAGVLTIHDGHDIVDLDCCADCAAKSGVTDTNKEWKAEVADGDFTQESS